MRPAVAILLSILALIFIVTRPWKALRPNDTHQKNTKKIVERKEKPPPPQPQVHPPSPHAAQLHHPETTPAEDLRILQQILADHRLITKQGNPTGTNLEITSHLTGNNPARIGPIPRDHPAISEKGELLDRFGTPYIFHNLTADHIEIRSAGPDRKARTSDDITLSNLPVDSPLRL